MGSRLESGIEDEVQQRLRDLTKSNDGEIAGTAKKVLFSTDGDYLKCFEYAVCADSIDYLENCFESFILRNGNPSKNLVENLPGKIGALGAARDAIKLGLAVNITYKELDKLEKDYGQMGKSS